MIDNTHTGGAAFVRIATCSGAWRAEAIRGTWNGWLVPVFTHSEAWAILTAHGYEFGDTVHGSIWYTDTTTGEATHLTQTNDGLYEFDGWIWESAEISRETVDVASSLIISNLDMEIVTGAMMETVEAWLAPESGEYANNTARNILADYAETIRAEIVTWELFETRFFRVLTQMVANA